MVAENKVYATRAADARRGYEMHAGNIGWSGTKRFNVNAASAYSHIRIEALVYNSESQS